MNLVSLWIHVIEYRSGNQEWMIQRNRLHLGLLDTGSRKTKLSTKQNTKNSNTAPTKTPGSESKCSRIFLPSPFTKKAGDYKTKSFSCNISIFYPFTFNTDERRVVIPLINLTPPYLYACPKRVPGFPTKYGICVFSELRWEMVVRFVDIGGNFDHQSLNILFIKFIVLNQLDFQSFDFERTLCRLLQKHDVHTQFEICFY